MEPKVGQFLEYIDVPHTSKDREYVKIYEVLYLDDTWIYTKLYTMRKHTCALYRDVSIPKDDLKYYRVMTKAEEILYL